tara:strand:- start:437 stop:595 length:159 start_codon:yes stop_codon:yes gene_type:complete
MKEWEIRVIESRKNLWIVTIGNANYTATKIDGIFFNSVTGDKLMNIIKAVKL